MRIKVDKKTDALYFRIDENNIVESKEIQPGVILDFNSDNQVVGLEILNVSKRTDPKSLSQMQFETI